MENRVFLNRYRVSLGWNGLPVELHRTPTAIMYRGQELESSREMAIELAPWTSTDPVARIIQAKLIETTGWNVIVDNKRLVFCWYAWWLKLLSLMRRG